MTGICDPNCFFALETQFSFLLSLNSFTNFVPSFLSSYSCHELDEINSLFDTNCLSFLLSFSFTLYESIYTEEYGYIILGLIICNLYKLLMNCLIPLQVR